jgi:hypothetical protein
LLVSASRFTAEGFPFGASSVIFRLSGHRLDSHIGNRAVRGNYVRDILIVLLQFHKVRNIEEGIALQANIHERGLHSRQHAGDAAFVNGSG